jgi:hypothetical protein
MTSPETQRSFQQPVRQTSCWIVADWEPGNFLAAKRRLPVTRSQRWFWRHLFGERTIYPRRESIRKSHSKNTKVSFAGVVTRDIRYLPATLLDGARKNTYGISIEETMKLKPVCSIPNTPGGKVNGEKGTVK